MIEATPVPVTPPQVPPRPPLWVVIEPPVETSSKRHNGWYWLACPEVCDSEDDAQEYANKHPGSVIFRLPGSEEVHK